MVLDMLTGIERPDLPQFLLERTDWPKIAWKTGTSFGRRDAWAVGVNPRYTIGVWLGNMDGSSVPQLSGAEMATPLLVEIFNQLEKGQDRTWFPKPETVQARRVCSHTGHLPSVHCEASENDWTLMGTTQAKLCDRFSEIWTDPQNRWQYCPVCLPNSGFKTQLLPHYPPDLIRWFKLKNRDFELPPPHFADCPSVFPGAGPEIQGYEADKTYLLEEGMEGPLQAEISEDIGQHYWYLNGEFVGLVAAGEELFVELPRGKVRIACMDDKGRMEQIEIEVASL